MENLIKASEPGQTGSGARPEGMNSGPARNSTAGMPWTLLSHSVSLGTTGGRTTVEKHAPCSLTMPTSTMQSLTTHRPRFTHPRTEPTRRLSAIRRGACRFKIQEARQRALFRVSLPCAKHHGVVAAKTTTEPQRCRNQAAIAIAHPTVARYCASPARASGPLALRRCNSLERHGVQNPRLELNAQHLFRQPCRTAKLSHGV